MNNKNFWGYSILLILYINYLLELESTFFSFKISEIAIIVILLFVLILIFNEINTHLYANFAERNIKYNKIFLFKPYTSLNIDNDLIKSDIEIKQIKTIEIKKEFTYKVLISLI